MYGRRNYGHRMQRQIIDCHLDFNARSISDSGLKDNPYHLTKTKLNSVALVRERTIPTQRPPPVGEVTVNFCG
jgi:hypothetical protein